MSKLEDLIEQLSSDIVERMEANGWPDKLAYAIAREVLEDVNENVELGRAIAELQEEKRAESSSELGVVDPFKPVLCLDFDGVCHSYTGGWQGAENIHDPPVPGLFEFLEEANKHFRIAVLSSRSGKPGGIPAMKAWFAKHGLGKGDAWMNLEFPTEKPPAKVIIDDRCIRFEGKWPCMADLLHFKPWSSK